jgi:hypothetical protein
MHTIFCLIPGFFFPSLCSSREESFWNESQFRAHGCLLHRGPRGMWVYKKPVPMFQGEGGAKTGLGAVGGHNPTRPWGCALPRPRDRESRGQGLAKPRVETRGSLQRRSLDLGGTRLLGQRPPRSGQLAHVNG